MHSYCYSHDWLAQGLVNACDTRAEQLFCSLVVEATVRKYMPTMRSFVNFKHVFERFSRCSEEPVRQAIPGILCTDTWEQFAVTDTTLVVLVATQ